MNKIAVGVLTLTTGLAVAATQAGAAAPQRTTGGVTYINSDMGVGQSKLTIVGYGTPADGEGRVKVRNSETGANYTGVVDCYHQYGNTSRSTGVITKGVVADGPNGDLKSGVGLFFTATIQDNGEGSKKPSPDMVAVNHRESSRFNCEVERMPERVVRHGNVQVHAQTPAPLAAAGIAGLPSDWSPDEVSD